MDENKELPPERQRPARQIEDTGLSRMLGSPRPDKLYGGTGLDFLYGNSPREVDDQLYNRRGELFEAADAGQAGEEWKQYAKETDLDGDGLVTFRLNSASIESDSDWLIRNILQTEYGDANLDHRVNSSDAAILGGNFGTISGASWSRGNFNGDGAVNSSDAAILGGHFGFQNTEARVGEQMAIVPEPHAHLLVAVAALTGLRMIWNSVCAKTKRVVAAGPRTYASPGRR